MYRSPPQLLNNASVFVSGDVTIDPSVAIAPGVILQADPDSQIVIATGVCIGMGVIVHAHQGRIEVEAGATIGAGVLVVGDGTIGAKASIGAEATLLNPAIAAKQVVAAGTIIGDESRSVTLSPSSEENSDSGSVEESPIDQEEYSQSGKPSEVSPETSSTLDTKAATAVQESSNPPATIIYGQVHLNHLLDTLLPHRKSLNNSKPNDRSP
ncbi:carbon dioxide concentrating mechanism protein [Limnoraphis robusta]|uniref:Carbon dioxide concentrating mechanism protein n=1 Tax=Limnoraphis robusta CCNP1315 TaxID=3110306 RepID=A0ABU5U809_9CYAN|nr:carbon dioxide concentrating mechanism protein [Limnoraphis robusta]MEA5522987.1 carbon dioxide concentrating mechanism protein [Limnoraphis robusta CCNP1315]MEA5545029.1 carbon dioxide concentrating mechanism protein [Limnoraphis robusta CCNP1324]